jgi:hypothetical protein
MPQPKIVSSHRGHVRNKRVVMPAAQQIAMSPPKQLPETVVIDVEKNQQPQGDGDTKTFYRTAHTGPRARAPYEPPLPPTRLEQSMGKFGDAGAVYVAKKVPGAAAWAGEKAGEALVAAPVVGPALVNLAQSPAAWYAYGALDAAAATAVPISVAAVLPYALGAAASYGLYRGARKWRMGYGIHHKKLYL